MRRKLATVVAWNAALLLLLLAAVEGVVRLFDVRPPISTVLYENDPTTGPWALPSQTAQSRSACFRVDGVHFNRFGMRDRERELESSKPRIALVGDSFTQGLQVRDEETVSRRLEEALGASTEVLNFGVSSTGPAVQLLNYRRRVRPFHPRVVVQLFFVGNDIADDLPALKERVDPAMAVRSPYLLLAGDGTLEKTPRPGVAYAPRRSVRMMYRFVVGQWLYYAVQRAHLRSAQRAAQHSDGPAQAPSDDERLWQQAWSITEAVLTRFAAEVRDDGAHFAVAVIPNDMVTFGKSGVADDKTREAVRRLTALGAHDGFAVLDLSAAFAAVPGRQTSTPLAYDCDGHWSAAGHAAAARALQQFLVAQGWL